MSLSATCVAYDTIAPCPVSKLALIEMADWANEDGETLIVLDDLIRFTCSPKAQVLTALQGLVDAGIIEIGEQDEKGRQRAKILGMKS